MFLRAFWAALYLRKRDVVDTMEENPLIDGDDGGENDREDNDGSSLDRILSFRLEDFEHPRRSHPWFTQDRTHEACCMLDEAFLVILFLAQSRD